MEPEPRLTIDPDVDVDDEPDDVPVVEVVVVVVVVSSDVDVSDDDVPEDEEPDEDEEVPVSAVVTCAGVSWTATPTRRPVTPSAPTADATVVRRIRASQRSRTHGSGRRAGVEGSSAGMQ